MAATFAYLREWGWTTDINMQDDWATIEQTLHQEAQQQRTSRFATVTAKSMS